MIVVAIVQLVLGVLLAIGSIDLAINIFDKLTKQIKAFEELKRGIVAIDLKLPVLLLQLP